MSLPATAITGMAPHTMSLVPILMTIANLALAAQVWTLCISLLAMALTKVSRLPLVIAIHGMRWPILPQGRILTLISILTIVLAPIHFTLLSITVTQQSMSPQLATAYFGMGPHITPLLILRHTLPPTRQAATAR